MNEIEPLGSLFAALDAALQRVEPTEWGAVVTDPRYPLIHDVNYARVDRGAGLRLEDVEAALVPALHAAGVRARHVATFDVVGSKALLDELEERGAKFNYDTVMAVSELRAVETQPVEELDPGEERFWAEQREALPEMDITGDVLDQYLDWQREVMVPFGKRWFGVRDGGRLLGSGALLLHDGAAYVDDVVTMPAFRRRGVASSVVTRIVYEAQRTTERIYLLADEPDPIRLYERLGFEEVGLAVGAVYPSS